MLLCFETGQKNNKGYCKNVGVRITDRQLHRIADIRFKPEGIFCELDENDNCKHIEFALTVPEIKEIIRDKRKEGWKLPDV